MNTYMEILMDIIQNPISWGVIGGLLLSFFIWNSSRKDRKYLKTEINRLTLEGSELQTHLSTQLKINAKGNESLQAKLDELTKQNETLRVNIQALQQKPEKSEQRRLEVMESAVTSMREQAPGFAPAWEKSLREAEEQMEAIEGGFTKLIRKVVPNFRATSGPKKDEGTKMLETKSE